MLKSIAVGAMFHEKKICKAFATYIRT